MILNHASMQHVLTKQMILVNSNLHSASLKCQLPPGMDFEHVLLMLRMWLFSYFEVSLRKRHVRILVLITVWMSTMWAPTNSCNSSYKLVYTNGQPVERTDKHPFCMSRVYYDNKERPKEVRGIVQWIFSSNEHLWFMINELSGCCLSSLGHPFWRTPLGIPLKTTAPLVYTRVVRIHVIVEYLQADIWHWFVDLFQFTPLLWLCMRNVHCFRWATVLGVIDLVTTDACATNIPVFFDESWHGVDNGKLALNVGFQVWAEMSDGTCAWRQSGDEVALMCLKVVIRQEFSLESIEGSTIDDAASHTFSWRVAHVCWILWLTYQALRVDDFRTKETFPRHWMISRMGSWLWMISFVCHALGGKLFQIVGTVDIGAGDQGAYSVPVAFKSENSWLPA